MGRVSACVLLLAVLPALAGCADTRGGSGPETVAATDERALAGSPPVYAVGDRYSFDNPPVNWEVVAISGDIVEWVSDAGERQTTSTNPLMPALAWESGTRGAGRRLISDERGSLFPLAKGRSMTFKSTVSTDQPPYAWEFDWSCAVTDEIAIEVPAGAFNTFRVACGRQRADELIFYYAPLIGHYVRMEAAGNAGEQPMVRRLLSYDRVERPEVATSIVSGEGTRPAPVFSTALTVEPAGPPPDAPTDEPDAAEPLLGGPVSIAPEAPSPAPPQPAERAAAPAATSPNVVGDGSGGFGLHLASYQERGNVDRGWRRLRAQLGGLLDPYEPLVRRVEISGRGTFYRLHAGPVEDRAAAVALCDRIQARGAYCKVLEL